MEFKFTYDDGKEMHLDWGCCGLMRVRLWDVPEYEHPSISGLLQHHVQFQTHGEYYRKWRNVKSVEWLVSRSGRGVKEASELVFQYPWIGGLTPTKDGYQLDIDNVPADQVILSIMFWRDVVYRYSESYGYREKLKERGLTPHQALMCMVFHSSNGLRWYDWAMGLYPDELALFMQPEKMTGIKFVQPPLKEQGGYCNDGVFDMLDEVGKFRRHAKRLHDPLRLHYEIPGEEMHKLTLALQKLYKESPAPSWPDHPAFDLVFKPALELCDVKSA